MNKVILMGRLASEPTTGTTKGGKTFCNVVTDDLGFDTDEEKKAAEELEKENGNNADNNEGYLFDPDEYIGGYDIYA